MTLTTIGQGRRDKETGEPDDATSVTSGSEGGWEKRPEVDLARSLPNCYFNPEHAIAVAYAQRCEDDAPATWEETDAEQAEEHR